MPKKPKSFSDMLSEWIKSKTKAPATHRKSADTERKPVKKGSATTKSVSRKEKEVDVKKLPRSEKRKRGYWQLFYYTFGTIFIVVGLVLILVFVIRNDPTVFGITNEYYEQAKVLVEQGDYDGAEALLAKCRSIDRSNADAILLLADIYDKQQRYSSELDVLMEGIGYDANSRADEFYKRIIKTYVKQNLIMEACAFCDDMDPYMQTRLADFRPTNIVTATDQGVYASAINVKLTVPEGTTVYYTLDGSFPDTKNSFIYSEEMDGITVNKGSVTIKAVAVNEEGYVSNLFSATYRIYNDNTPYEFVDEAVEAIIRSLLNRSASDNIYYKDLSKISVFTTDVHGITSSHPIRSLEDLSVLVNLRSVILEGQHSVEDYGVLNLSESLESLSISGSSLTDDALRQIFSLSKITSLSLVNNAISRISDISSMQNLTDLDLSDNFIVDISPLSSLENLKQLNLANNRIADLSALSSIKGLTALDISDNAGVTSLKGISLLKSLQTLSVKNLKVTSLSVLSGFQQLHTLYLDGASFTSVAPLANCTKLAYLSANNTAIKDFDALNKTALTTLYAANCGLNDLSFAASLPKLAVLDVHKNILTLVSPLADCANLTHLNVSNNYITDISALLDCPALSSLECVGCTISGNTLTQFAEKGVSVLQ